MNSKVYPIIPRYKMLKDMIKNAMRDPAYMEGAFFLSFLNNEHVVNTFFLFQFVTKHTAEGRSLST